MATLPQSLLLGTERLPTPPEPAHPALAAAWAHLSWTQDAPRALLDANALAAITEQAAQAPTEAPPPPELAPVDPRPVASAAAVASLRRLVRDEHLTLLPEWLGHCARAGRRLPPFFLPTLLASAKSTELRAALRQLAGPRELWLAKLNPEWAWIASDAKAAALGAEIWETGDADTRLAWLRQTRAHAPADACAALDRTWSEEKPEFRLAAVALLTVGLTLADEPLLKRALKERRKETRSTAQALLATLPGSALRQSLISRTEPLLDYHRGFLSRRLDVTLPSAFAPEWAADGIDEKPPTGVGERAFWTHQLLSLVPIEHWLTRFGLERAKLFELAAKSSDWADLLLGAWAKAATSHADAASAEALVPLILARPDSSRLPEAPPALVAEGLLAACSPAARWHLALAHPPLLWSALPSLTPTHDLGHARALLTLVAPSIRGGLVNGGSATAAQVARLLPPTLHAEAVRLLERENGFSKPADAFLQTLDLRGAIHAAFP